MDTTTHSTDFSFPIGIISNTKSKQNKKELLNLHILASIIGNRSKCLLKETSSLDDLKESLAFFKKKDVKIILSNGGDGTHQKLISYLISFFPEFSPYIVPLKGGTMNMLTKNLNLDCSPYSTARWVKLIAAKKTVPRIQKLPILKITINNKSTYGFVFVSGCAYKRLNLYYKYDNRGPSAAIKSILKPMAEMILYDKNKYYFDYTDSDFIFNDTKSSKIPYLVTIASSIKTLILGFNPFGNLKVEKKEFYTMIDGEPIINDYNIAKFYRFSNNETWNTKRVVAKLKKLELDVDSGYTIDGEMFDLKSKTKVTIEAGPEINFLVPNMFLFF
jgi:hypothetical protein